MKTCTPQAPLMPAVWPGKERTRPGREQLPDTANEPKHIGYYLKPLLGIAGKQDRENVLQEYFKGTYV